MNGIKKIANFIFNAACFKIRFIKYTFNKLLYSACSIIKFLST